MDSAANTITLEQLRQVKRWVAWQKQDRGKGKPTKVPYDPKNGRLARSDDPSTWGTREQAEEWAKKLPMPYGVGGVGLMFGPLDGVALGGVDLDSCRNKETGSLEEWASEVLTEFETYAEISPSQEGVKAFFSYDPERLKDIVSAMGSESGKQWKRKGGDHPQGIELYINKRYFAVTDQLFGEETAIKQVSCESLLFFIDTAKHLIADPEADMDEGRQPRAKRGRASEATPRAPKAGGTDQSRSGRAHGVACGIIRAGDGPAEFLQAVLDDPELAQWLRDQPDAERQLDRTWKAAQQAVDKAGWRDQLQLDRYGSPRPSHVNIMLMLRNDPKLADLIAFDDMISVPVIMHPIMKGDIRKHPRPLEDMDVLALLEYLQKQGLSTATKDTVFNAVLARSGERHFHPVRDYLNGLTWDGTPRIWLWLIDYMGADRSEYVAEVGAMFLISMVARVFEPGCKADHMLVLEGPQNQGKSLACRVLAGEWFSDNLPALSVDEVRSSMALRGKWLIEIAEMHAMGRAEAAQLKAFVSRQEERYVAKYARLEVTEPRQTVFVGTTNKREYLQDETGGRRFWPVSVSNVDITKLTDARDQLFAESVHLYRKGVVWWPDGSFEAQHISDEQEGRFEADEWQRIVAEWLTGNLTTRTTIGDVGFNALLIDKDQLTPDKQRRITKILERLGWQRRRTKQERWWELPAKQ